MASIDLRKISSEMEKNGLSKTASFVFRLASKLDDLRNNAIRSRELRYMNTTAKTMLSKAFRWLGKEEDGKFMRYFERTRWDPYSGRLSLGGGDVDDNLLMSIFFLKNLTFLDLSETDVSDLSPLSRLKDLEHLNLRGTRVSDLFSISNLRKLEFLSIDSTNVTDIGPIKGLTKLEKLVMGNTHVSDISPLSGLVNLRQIGMENTNVKDLSPLKKLEKLESISVPKGVDLTPLRRIVKRNRDFRINGQWVKHLNLFL